MIGLRVQDPLRHFNKGSLRGAISYLEYSQADYLQWIQQQELAQGDCEFDVGLICRLLNNLSIFKLNFSNNWRVMHKLGEAGLGQAAWRNRRFEPHNCLNPDSLSTENIFLKNSNVSLKVGKRFRHLSLSNYYKGLQLLDSQDHSKAGSVNAVCFPIREFNPASLQLPNGMSVLGRLCDLARLIVIEDIDLTKKTLIEHLIGHDLDNIAVSYVSKHIRSINSAQIFCLCNIEFEDCLPGKRIWPDSLQRIGSQMSLRLRNYAVFQKYRQSI